jgi:hypothetical protein
MIEWYKDGKALPKRYVWEIVLGAHAQFAAEASLVDLDVEEGMTCDVIGDVHGLLPPPDCSTRRLKVAQGNSTMCSTCSRSRATRPRRTACL